ncbi:PAS domain S-box protein [Sorangium sp. So ce117]|uniref:PAS domain S-box protein n=1 Tax=Sorangium sp. So ce117 TaxID=3133277 RepID=UPI003F5F3C34
MFADFYLDTGRRRRARWPSSAASWGTRFAMIMGMSSLKRLWPLSCGPLFTFLVVLAVMLAKKALLGIPNPPAILVLALVYSAYVGGIIPGLISATFSWLYIALFFSISGQPFHYTDENLQRVIVWAITLPATALMVGRLKRQTMRQMSALQESELRLRSVIDNMVDAVFTFDQHGAIKYLNPAAELLFGFGEREVARRDVSTFLVTSSAPAPGGDAKDASQLKCQPLGFLDLPVNRREMLCRHRDGGEFPVEVSVAEMAFGAERLFIGTTRDIRERKLAEEERRRAEEERSRFQEELIRVQANAIAEISTPLIPVRRRVLVMPLVGSMDSQRVVRVIDVLLKGISVHSAHSAILDITGVPVVDTLVASGLVQAAHAARLLGARVVLTGIRPEVAMTLVTLGAEFHGVVTCRTLEQGITYAEAQER